MTRLEPLPSTLPDARPETLVPRGFAAGGWTAGIKVSGRPDLAVIATTGPEPAAVAATFTLNKVVAAPVVVSRRNLRASDPEGDGRYGWAKAVLCTSGSANAATGEVGERDQEQIGAATGELLGATPAGVMAMSTGVIGTRLPVELVERALRAHVRDGLSSEPVAFEAAAESMRTTDSRRKVASVDAGPFRVLGIAKGVGMIHPRMATMLSVVMTDAAARPADLSAILRRVVARTWDQLSVDGDTSTNDTVFLLASGAAPDAEAVDLRDLESAVESVARSLARQQAADGEGARTLLSAQVSGARDDIEARAVARAIVSSSLVKAAVHGRDPNWGRLAGAIGNAQLPDAEVLEASGLDRTGAWTRAGNRVEIDPSRLTIAVAGTTVFAGGPLPFDGSAVRRAMDADEVLVRVDLGTGTGTGEAWGCDLTEAYVIENSAYTT